VACLAGPGVLSPWRPSYCDVSPLLRASVRLPVSVSLSVSVWLSVCLCVLLVAAIDLSHYCSPALLLLLARLRRYSDDRIVTLFYQRCSCWARM